MIQVVSLLLGIAATQNVHIARVENGVLPKLVVQAELGKGMNILDRMAYYKIPGLSIAIINNGKIEWAKGYGVLDLESKKPVTTDTLFQAGSVSKSVAAMGALTLVEKGSLNLDEDVNTRLKSWKVPSNKFTETQNVTLRRILSHTAGLTVHGFGGYEVGGKVPTTIEILDGKAPANSAAIRVDTTPGTIWRYSGGGYTVMQLEMEDVTQQPFATYMHEKVLSKLGMTGSSFAQPLPEDWSARTATGYYPEQQKVPGRWHVYPEMAAAGLWSTPTDLARFAIDIQDTLAGRSSKVLSQKMVRQMLTNEKNNDGLGVFLAGQGGNQRFFHNGRDEGFDSMMVAYATTGQGAVIMANTNMNNDFVNEVLRGIAKEYQWPGFATDQQVRFVVSAAQMKELVGSYRLNADVVLSIVQKGEALFVEAPGQPDLELVPRNEKEFYIAEASATITFTRDKDGKVLEMSILQGGQTAKAKRV